MILKVPYSSVMLKIRFHRFQKTVPFTWTGMLDELQEHVESIDLANGLIFLHSYFSVFVTFGEGFL